MDSSSLDYPTISPPSPYFNNLRAHLHTFDLLTYGINHLPASYKSTRVPYAANETGTSANLLHRGDLFSPHRVEHRLSGSPILATPPKAATLRPTKQTNISFINHLLSPLSLRFQFRQTPSPCGSARPSSSLRSVAVPPSHLRTYSALPHCRKPAATSQARPP